MKYLLTVLMILVVITNNNLYSQSDDNYFINILTINGFKKQVEYYPDKIKNIINLQPDVIELKKIKNFSNDIDQIIDDITSDFIFQSLVKKLKLEFQKEQFAEYEKFYISDLGKKVVDMEISMSAIQGQSEMIKHQSNLKNNPPSKNRMKTIQKLDEISRITERTYNLHKSIYSIFNNSHSKKFRPDIYNKLLDNYLSNIKDLEISHLIYIYRDLNDQELEEYVNFLSNDNPAKITGAIFQALDNHIENLCINKADKLKPYFDKFFKMIDSIHNSYNWKNVKSKDGSFSFASPIKPEEIERSIDAAGGSIKINQYIVVNDEVDVVVLLAYTDFTEKDFSKKGKNDEEVLENSINGGIGGNSLLLSQRKINLKNYKGAEIYASIINGAGLLRARIFVVGKRIYQLIIAGARFAVEDPIYDRFFESLKLEK